MQLLSILASGMVTGVGLNAPSTCAAIRCGINNFQETRFMDKGGEWIIGSEVPLEQPWRGRTKLLKMASAAIMECLESNPQVIAKATPLLLCLPEVQRPGRLVSDDHRFLRELQDDIGVDFHDESRVIAGGRVSLALAMKDARLLLKELKLNHVIVAGTDSLLSGSTLSYYEERDRLLTSRNSNGFIPGEVAAALLIEPFRIKQEGQLVLQGIGFGVEKAIIDSEEPLRADGLTSAIKESLHDAGIDESVLQFKIVDVSGEQYYFKEASLAWSRIDRTKRKEFDFWHPAECVGEVGAAIGVLMFAVLKAACVKGYAKGNHVMAHLANDDGRRAAMIFSWHAAGGDRGQ